MSDTESFNSDYIDEIDDGKTSILLKKNSLKENIKSCKITYLILLFKKFYNI
jgi:hypothetical protein